MRTCNALVFSIRDYATGWCWRAVTGTFLLSAVAAAVVQGSTDPNDRFTNSLGLTFMRVPASEFTMGSPLGDWDEEPRRRVTISHEFHLAETEVTNAQYELFDPSHARWRGQQGISAADDEPVVFVSWHEAVAFCAWLTQREGKPYRLPTEAEWEYACRAGTETEFWTGDTLPAAHHRNQPIEGDWLRVKTRADDDLRAKKGKVPVSLAVGAMPANPWGLRGMHGSVEEWVADWYGRYPLAAETDPVGPADGLFKVARGGSHNTFLPYLRSADRSATVPEDKHWLIGFRVVQGPPPPGPFRAAAEFTMDDATVASGRAAWAAPAKHPVFLEPIPFVVPDEDHAHLRRLHHHHNPTVTWCDNGDLLAAWFNTRSEVGREMVIVASRLRRGAAQWEKARLFFAPADRNTTGTTLFNDGQGRLYFFNAIAESSHHRDQCLVLSTSEDHGRSWSRPRVISDPQQRHKYTPLDAMFVARDGSLVLSIDYAPPGHPANEAGAGVFVSSDRGATWINRISGKPTPVVVAGGRGGLIAGFHTAVAQLADGRLMAFGRTRDIDGRMPLSLSSDMGETWTYHRSEFPPIDGGQRLAFLRLREGPLLFVSFTDVRGTVGLPFTTASGQAFTGFGLFAALSFDEGATWPGKRLLTAGGSERLLEGGGNTGRFRMDETHAEPKGYLAATQTPDGMIHLLSSRNHYRFNLVWLRATMPHLP
jgi:formylglycine-generating enzyme required for sulfatase activity